jgi:hypothetical protein
VGDRDRQTKRRDEGKDIEDDRDTDRKKKR